MAVLMCKVCGGDLEITEGMTVCRCEFCMTRQTIPGADDEKKTKLFNRANRLRLKSNFDESAGVFESIVSEFPEEAEAYWGLCLCKFGIEYVDDPVTGKKIPTCHRTSFDSIFDDEDFKQACENADAVSRKLYREEAKEIERLQQSILDIAKNEAPYDIFICYKETAEDGQRTKDSVMAQDIYDALTEKGYKVFFSRITLEDKLGQEYEPYIFSALNSSKVMLAIGTDYEYFNAVWVRNEWSRFLDLMKKDKSKVLIPCYADIDAYDMPSEFRNLQGQDMNKVGFLQDLVRGIGKIIPIGNEPQAAAAPASGANIENLLKRGNLALKEGNWKEAEGFFERVLDANAEEGRGYLGKFLAESHISAAERIPAEASKSLISDAVPSLMRFGLFRNAVEYSAPAEKEKLKNYDLETRYFYAAAYARNVLPEDKTCRGPVKAAKLFYAIKDYKESYELARKYFKEAMNRVSEPDDVTFLQSLPELPGLVDDPEKAVADMREQVCELKYEKAFKYKNMADVMEDSDSGFLIHQLTDAIKAFNEIPDYKDSAKMARACEETRDGLYIGLGDKLCASGTPEDCKYAIEMYRMVLHTDVSQKIAQCTGKLSLEDTKQKLAEEKEAVKGLKRAIRLSKRDFTKGKVMSLIGVILELLVILLYFAFSYSLNNPEFLGISSYTRGNIIGSAAVGLGVINVIYALIYSISMFSDTLGLIVSVIISGFALFIYPVNLIRCMIKGNTIARDYRRELKIRKKLVSKLKTELEAKEHQS